MKKKILATVLTAAMAVSMLAGCSSESASKASEAAATTAEATTAAEETKAEETTAAEAKDTGDLKDGFHPDRWFRSSVLRTVIPCAGERIFCGRGTEC